MPFLLLLMGLLLIVTGFQDTYKELGTQVQKDFTGPGNFAYWIIALGLLGALGYFKPLKIFSDMAMGLIIVVMVVKTDGGKFFQDINPAIQQGTTESVGPIGTPLQGGSGGSGGGGGSGGDLGSTLTNAGIEAVVSSFL